ncbi:hypothetical protein Vafri_1910, partial [Volvox africanus]
SCSARSAAASAAARAAAASSLAAFCSFCSAATMSCNCFTFFLSSAAAETIAAKSASLAPAPAPAAPPRPLRAAFLRISPRAIWMALMSPRMPASSASRAALPAGLAVLLAAPAAAVTDPFFCWSLLVLLAVAPPAWAPCTSLADAAPLSVLS